MGESFVAMIVIFNDFISFQNLKVDPFSKVKDLAISNLSLIKDTGKFYCRIETRDGYFLGNWTLNAKSNRGEIAIYRGTGEVREAEEVVQEEVFLLDTLYIIGCVMSVCFLVLGVYITFFKQPNVDLRIESDYQVVIERTVESSSSDSSYYHYPRDTSEYA